MVFRTGIQIFDSHLYIQNPMFIGRIQVCHHFVIVNACSGLGVEGNAALDATQPPEILALEIGTVAPFENLQSDKITLAQLHELGNIKL